MMRALRLSPFLKSSSALTIRFFNLIEQLLVVEGGNEGAIGWRCYLPPLQGRH